MIDPGHPRLAVQRQCALVSISLSAFDIAPKFYSMVSPFRGSCDQLPVF